MTPPLRLGVWLVAATCAVVPSVAPNEPADVGGTGAARSVRRAAVDDSSVATLEDSSRVFLEAQTRPGDSYVALSMRYTGSELAWAAIERANDARRVEPGRFYAIPFEVLSARYKALSVAALFPGDGPGDDGWVHRVPESDRGQTFEVVALWFTGDPSLADDLAESNGLEWAPLAVGAEVVIPQAILLPQFAELGASLGTPKPPPPAAPPPERPSEPPRPRRAPAKPTGPVQAGDLTFIDDQEGGHAVYRLKRGEALYTAVVVRFTGRLDPEEVADVTRKIAALSGVRKLTSIPVGRRIRIPRDLILPEFLPPGDPARAAYEAGLEAAGRHRITAQARDLEGVTLILDSGHGGDDVGARHNGVHEDDHMYDILCRLKSLAERTTAAKVLTTIRDRSAGYEPQEGPLSIDRDEEILSTPRYVPRQPHVGTVGVNLRWYVVNSYYRAARAAGSDPQRIVFLSLHADALHPSVRGAMVYVPGQDYRAGTYGCVGRLYDRKEVGELRYVKFSSREREVSEGLSRRLAGAIVEAFRSAGLPVHPYEPIRDHVIRRRREWTPAVIRASLVPQSLLLEIVNLNNPRDAALLKDAGFRQRAAAAVLEALRSHYQGARGGRATVSAGAR